MFVLPTSAGFALWMQIKRWADSIFYCPMLARKTASGVSWHILDTSCSWLATRLTSCLYVAGTGGLSRLETDAMNHMRTVFFVSDGTGLTAEGLAHSLLAQFENFEYSSATRPFVNSVEQAQRVVREINAAARLTSAKPLVFCTLVDPRIRSIVHACEGAVFDLYDAFLEPVADALAMAPAGTVGRAHGMDSHTGYGMRMDAVNFALSTDDGTTTHGYEHADVIIIGVSRSGKTPTCLYLALQYGLRAANYPLTDEDLDDVRLPFALVPFRERLYALIIDPQRLHEIRSERRPDSRYASLKQCRYELNQLAALYRQEGLRPLDTTHMSVEEIASTIAHDAGLQRSAR